MNGKAEKEFRTTIIGNIDVSQIPDYVQENLIESLHAAVLRAWNDPEIRARYEQWKLERQANSGVEADHGRGK